MESKYNRCDFCSQREPNGKCTWTSHSCREEYCEKAIDKMIKIMIEIGKKENKK